MKQLPLIASTLYAQPWCILPDVHSELSENFRNYLDGRLPSSLDGSGSDMSGGICYEVKDGLALIQLSGVVVKKAMPDLCGPPLIDLAVLDLLLMDIAADESIRTLVLDLDTPGGCAIGLSETAERMAAVRESGTRIVAFTDFQCCSAGYWLAACADEIIASPSAQVGSIGTYIALLDETERMKMKGLKLRLFRDGDFKALGMPGKEWTEKEEQFMSDRLEFWSAQFKDHVRSRRSGITDETMQGQSFDAGSAPAGLIDRLELSIVEVLADEMERLSAA
jgi:capsid assembly protease